MQIRVVAPDNPAELHTVVAFSMMATWEGILEARGDYSVVPGFSVKERSGLYARTVAAGSPDFRVLVATDDEGNVRGCSVIRIAVDSRNKRYGHWIDFYVEPDWRRHGLGAGLMAATEQFVLQRGASYVYSEVHYGNHKAVALFQKHGYQLTGPRKGRFWFYVAVKRLAGSVPPVDER